MNNPTVASMLLAMLLGVQPAFAADGKVTISAPAEGAIIAVHKGFSLHYAAEPGTNGDHLHLNIDGKRADVIHPLKGTLELEPMAAGKHKICLALNTKGHTPTGPEACVHITVQ